MEEAKKQPWQPTCPRFVAFLDIMGFKDMVARKSHKEIYDMLYQISQIEEVVNTTNVIKDDVYITKFSDSIVVFSANDSKDCLDNFILVVNVIFAATIGKKIPMKGSMAFGEISVNKSGSIFFGQPIIDAYLLQEDLYYYGIVCHHTFDEKVEKIAYKSGLIVKTETPMKSSGNIKHNNLWWYFNFDSFCEKFEPQKEPVNVLEDLYLSVSGKPRKYIDNTLDMYKKYSETIKVKRNSRQQGASIQESE